MLPPAGAIPNPVLAYEVDYATSGKYAAGSVNGVGDTMVSIGFPASTTLQKCNVRVEWSDWDGAPADVSGNDSLSPGVTLEFTTSVNFSTPTEYPPLNENIFSNITAPFEGYAHIPVDTGCKGAKYRVDAEFVTQPFRPPAPPSATPSPTSRSPSPTRKASPATDPGQDPLAQRRGLGQITTTPGACSSTG